MPKPQGGFLRITFFQHCDRDHLFVVVWVTECRMIADHAVRMKDLRDAMDPEAEVIRVCRTI